MLTNLKLLQNRMDQPLDCLLNLPVHPSKAGASYVDGGNRMLVSVWSAVCLLHSTLSVGVYTCIQHNIWMPLRVPLFILHALAVQDLTDHGSSNWTLENWPCFVPLKSAYSRTVQRPLLYLCDKAILTWVLIFFCTSYIRIIR